MVTYGTGQVAGTVALDQPLFAMYLNPDISADPAGELSFGAVNPSLYVGKITYTPVTQQKCACPPPRLGAPPATCGTIGHTIQ